VAATVLNCDLVSNIGKTFIFTKINTQNNICAIIKKLANKTNKRKAIKKDKKKANPEKRLAKNRK